MSDRSVVDALRKEAQALGPHEHFTSLLQLIGDAPIVLLGEATHGTREFYTLRAEITRRLILEKGFEAVAVEADWPDALRVSRYVQHASADNTADHALGGFQRFPQWMWRNTEVVALIDWLRRHNHGIHRPEWRVGFFGLDLYSLRKSMDAVIRYLDKVDPKAAQIARKRYGCFGHLAENPQRYGYAATFGMNQDCEDEVVEQLVYLMSERAKYLEWDVETASDELFYAQQNARVAKNAEQYYRSMFKGRDESWNVRDIHMAETLEALRQHLMRHKGSHAKIVIWAHNSHIGDARATEMGAHGQLNLGQLMRERYGADETRLVGFTTHAGTVSAASDWDSPVELKQVRPSRPDSFEHLFHEMNLNRFLLPVRGKERVQGYLCESRLERAIGVIYLPESERVSHYFHADMSRQFDAVIHVDRTAAVQPLDHSIHWSHEEMPETYPSGI
ncbi:MAG: erythromycin esterase family protein [Burkholderiales bacterium]|nr:erythromycin esterase family protein [Burkholderiales bacterium]